MTNETLRYYNENAESFFNETIENDMSEAQSHFLSHLQPGARILDAGCGSGRDTRIFLDKGYEAAAFDGSEEMCRVASAYTGISVQCLRFEEVEGENEYDGIWACASLIHVGAGDLPDALRRLCRLLKPEGVIYASFKGGDEDQIRDGRYYHNVSEQALTDLFTDAGFTVEELYAGNGARQNTSGDIWYNMIARKK